MKDISAQLTRKLGMGGNETCSHRLILGQLLIPELLAGDRSPRAQNDISGNRHIFGPLCKRHRVPSCANKPSLDIA